MRMPSVFYAIPCGEFYAQQASAIREVSRTANIKPVIAEDDPTTKGLWEKIIEEIDKCDLFVADVSSKSPNIAVELGYAVARKPEGSIGIFISDNVDVPSDLRRFVLQKYSSLASFRKGLIDWLSETLPMIDSELFDDLEDVQAEFTEDFKSEELFLRRWWTPPYCQYSLTHEGLHFTWAHFPIMTTTVGLLQDYEFEFLGRIDSTTIGWVVKGTLRPHQTLPASCVMFNLSGTGHLLPHIWSTRKVDPVSHYHAFADQAVDAQVSFSTDGWLRLLTRVRGGLIEVENEGNLIFSGDFSQEPYRGHYGPTDLKEGQVGFRCHPGEEATVAQVRVREL